MFEKIELIAREAGKIMLSALNREKTLGEKTSNADIVTEYDVKIQEYLFSELSKVFTDAEFVGEEGETDKSIAEKISGKAFIIDPIDGTTNFVRNLRKSAISIAYLENGECVYGCAYVPYCDEMFTAHLGKGAYLNGKRIKCNDYSIEHSVAAVGTAPYYKQELGNATFDIMHTFFNNAMDIRRMGSAVMDICDVACGRTDIFCELRLSPWDYAAAALIASEAGAVVSDMKGDKLVYDRKISVLAATPKCLEFYNACPEIQKYRELF